MRYRPRTDANQPDIVKAMIKAGATVRVLAPLGGGIPDLLIGHCGWNALAEVKDPAQPRRDRALSRHPKEAEFHKTWKGQAEILETVEQALELLTKMEHWGDW
jgi:hypothetical protein